MTSIRHDRLSRVMAFLQSRVRASHDEIFSVGEYNSNRTLQNDLYYLRDVYGADIQYDNRRKLYVMESAGNFQLDLKISRSEIEALTAGLRMVSHFLPHLKKCQSNGSYLLTIFISEAMRGIWFRIITGTRILAFTESAE